MIKSKDIKTEFAQKLNKLGITIYRFAKDYGMKWETINNYYQGNQEAPKKVMVILDSLVNEKYGKKENSKATGKTQEKTKRAAA